MSGPGPSTRSHTELVRSLHALVREALGSVLRGFDRVALVDVPTHTNVGDSSIWLGELAVLKEIGVRVAHVSDLETFDAGRVRRAVGDGPVLIHGGGNMGDLWPRHQRHREMIVRALPDNSIVQLPQSIEFRDPGAERGAAAILDAHPRLTLLVRDHRSLERARRIFDAPTHLCPDMAFCLQPVVRTEPASVDVLALLREDQESSGPHPRTAATMLESGGRVVDWLTESPSVHTARGRVLAARVRGGGLRGRLAEPRLRRAWERAAGARVARGLRLLGEGRVVVTDRLHAHVLCVMAGIPHVLVPDRFGKVEAFVDTWTAGAPRMRRVGTIDEAWATAVEMAEENGTG